MTKQFAIVGNNEYVTLVPTVYEWVKGEIRFRLVIPAGQNTDLASAPWWARFAGFKKEDERWHRASKIHDFLYYQIKNNNGILPMGYYQFWQHEEWRWRNIITPQWKRKEADDLFLKIMLEDGFPQGKARLAHRAVRIFGGLHMRLS